MKRRNLIGLFLTISCSGLAGCSDSARPTLTSVSAGKRDAQPSIAAAVSDEPATAPVKPDSRVAATFQPPFPHREDLFNPPAKLAAAPERPESVGDVKLRGFVNVDGVRALLVINGQITPTVAGQQYAGIDVIAIEPPQVTLQRGRIRWTERLYQ